MELLEVENLYKEFYKDKVKFVAVDHIHFSIREGECLGLVGESGCGKSTLLRQLKTVLAPSGNTSGQILYRGVSLKDTDHRTQSQEIGFVMQNPDNQIVAGVVEEDVAFGPENIGVPTEEIWERVGTQSGGSRHDSIPLSFSEPFVRWSETARCHCRCCGNGAQMHHYG